VRVVVLPLKSMRRMNMLLFVKAQRRLMIFARRRLPFPRGEIDKAGIAVVLRSFQGLELFSGEKVAFFEGMRT